MPVIWQLAVNVTSLSLTIPSPGWVYKASKGPGGRALQKPSAKDKEAVAQLACFVFLLARAYAVQQPQLVT